MSAAGRIPKRLVIAIGGNATHPEGIRGTPSEQVEVAAKLGGFYPSHVRYTLGDRFLDPFREAIDIGRRGSSPSCGTRSATRG